MQRWRNCLFTENKEHRHDDIIQLQRNSSDKEKAGIAFNTGEYRSWAVTAIIIISCGEVRMKQLSVSTANEETVRTKGKTIQTSAKSAILLQTAYAF